MKELTGEILKEAGKKYCEDFSEKMDEWGFLVSYGIKVYRNGRKAISLNFQKDTQEEFTIAERLEVTKNLPSSYFYDGKKIPVVFGYVHSAELQG